MGAATQEVVRMAVAVAVAVAKAPAVTVAVPKVRAIRVAERAVEVVASRSIVSILHRHRRSI